MQQLCGQDPDEIIIPFSKQQQDIHWQLSDDWPRAFSNFMGKNHNIYSKDNRIQFLKRTQWILPKIISPTPLSGAETYFTDANKQGMAGYSNFKENKVVQSPYQSVQKAELSAIVMLLQDKDSMSLNIITDSQYTKFTVQHIETATIFDDGSNLHELFLQLQMLLRLRHDPVYITHIHAHSLLPGPLSAGNANIDQLVGTVTSTQREDNMYHSNARALKEKSYHLGTG